MSVRPVGSYILKRLLDMNTATYLYYSYYFWPVRVDPFASRLGLDSRRIRRFVETLKNINAKAGKGEQVPFIAEVKYYRLGLELRLFRFRRVAEVPLHARVFHDWFRSFFVPDYCFYGIGMAYIPLARRDEVLEEMAERIGEYEELGVVEKVLLNHIDYPKYLRYIIEAHDVENTWKALLNNEHRASFTGLPENLRSENYVVATPDDAELLKDFLEPPRYEAPRISSASYRILEALVYNSMRDPGLIAADAGIPQQSLYKHLKHLIPRYVTLFAPGVHPYPCEHLAALLYFNNKHSLRAFLEAAWGFPAINGLYRLRTPSGGHALFISFHVSHGEEDHLREFLVNASRELGFDVEQLWRIRLLAPKYIARLTLPPNHLAQNR